MFTGTSTKFYTNLKVGEGVQVSVGRMQRGFDAFIIQSLSLNLTLPHNHICPRGGCFHHELTVRMI